MYVAIKSAIKSNQYYTKKINGDLHSYIYICGYWIIVLSVNVSLPNYLVIYLCVFVGLFIDLDIYIFTSIMKFIFEIGK